MPSLCTLNDIEQSPVGCPLRPKSCTSKDLDVRPAQAVRPPPPSRTISGHGNTRNFKIIDSTLREGEQYATAYFDTETKIAIARALDEFGVDYLELTSPVASEQSRKDCEAICKLGLKAKILTHVRCNMADARAAVEAGVDGVNLLIGTSPQLMRHSHGKNMSQIETAATEVIRFVKKAGVEVRFSGEDSFRSDLDSLTQLYSLAESLGVDRVGIADTVGVASPRQVYKLVRAIRHAVGCDIETHFHNDTGCAVANAFCALEAGATHIDTTVLGLGERNGITSIGALLARLAVEDRAGVANKYRLPKLRDLELLVAKAAGVDVPFNNPVTGVSSFVHTAGIHAKAILGDPGTYEVLNPEDWGLSRDLRVASRLTGRHAIRARAEQLGIELDDGQAVECTAQVKKVADCRQLSAGDTDAIIRAFAASHLCGTENTCQAMKPPLPTLHHELRA